MRAGSGGWSGFLATRHSPLTTGFTLIEVLVVIVIISIVISFISLSIGGDRRAEEIEREARRFAALLEMASEQAVLRSEEWGVRVEDDGYRFMVLDDTGKRWLPVADDAVFRPRTLPDWMRLEVELEGLEVELGEQEQEKPTVFLLSSGEMTAFTATFSALQSEVRYRVVGDPLGRVEADGGEG